MNGANPSIKGTPYDRRIEVNCAQLEALAKAEEKKIGNSDDASLAGTPLFAYNFLGSLFARPMAS